MSFQVPCNWLHIIEVHEGCVWLFKLNKVFGWLLLGSNTQEWAGQVFLSHVEAAAETCHYAFVFIRSQGTVTTKAFSTPGSSLENSATITVISFPIRPDIRKRSRVLPGLDLKAMEKFYIFTHRTTTLIALCTMKTREVSGSPIIKILWFCQISNSVWPQKTTETNNIMFS